MNLGTWKGQVQCLGGPSIRCPQDSGMTHMFLPILYPTLGHPTTF